MSTGTDRSVGAQIERHVGRPCDYCNDTFRLDEVEDDEVSDADGLRDDEIVRCPNCYTTPDGTLVLPGPSTSETDGLRDDDRERYRISNRVVMMGGFEDAYPNEKTRRDDEILSY